MVAPSTPKAATLSAATNGIRNKALSRNRMEIISSSLAYSMIFAASSSSVFCFSCSIHVPHSVIFLYFYSSLALLSVSHLDFRDK